MATYKEIQKYIKEMHNISVKTCWIAHAKEKCGIPLQNAQNRKSKDFRTNPCPVDKFELIKNAFKYFKMI